MYVFMLFITLYRNKDIKNAVTIDMHGQQVKDAIRLLKLHLILFSHIPCKHLSLFASCSIHESWIFSELIYIFSAPAIQFLTVITGCGKHGVGNGKIKQSVCTSNGTLGSYFDLSFFVVRLGFVTTLIATHQKLDSLFRFFNVQLISSHISLNIVCSWHLAIY